MTTNKIYRYATYIIIAAILLSACASKNNSTGVTELDKIIDIVLRGNVDELKSVIKLTEAKCTVAEGLGGPPKCKADEQEGTIVEVLPILDSEGYFLRKDELKAWGGLEVSSLFAVYEISDTAYSDENYPAGQYALVFIDKDKRRGITLHVDQGSVVRMDYGFEYPPTIPAKNVARYLIQPVNQ